MTPRFGTDGLRGRAGSELTTALAAAVGRAGAAVLAPAGSPVAIGR
ncbi:MAG: phosphoglucosamine mutase, partial [Actinomyces sp.]